MFIARTVRTNMDNPFELFESLLNYYWKTFRSFEYQLSIESILQSLFRSLWVNHVWTLKHVLRYVTSKGMRQTVLDSIEPNAGKFKIYHSNFNALSKDKIWMKNIHLPNLNQNLWIVCSLVTWNYFKQNHREHFLQWDKFNFEGAFSSTVKLLVLTCLN